MLNVSSRGTVLVNSDKTGLQRLSRVSAAIREEVPGRVLALARFRVERSGIFRLLSTSASSTGAGCGPLGSGKDILMAVVIETRLTQFM